jgi:DNA-binding NtrC family response regulator
MTNWNLGFAEGRTPIRSYKILIADNEYLIRWSLGQALSQQGYEVVSVEDGKKAIEAATAQHFDFIITDIYMPELDGWHVLEMARQVQPQPRVIIITAKGSEDTGRIAKERGAWAYVEKPYIIDRIKELLKETFTGEIGSNIN